MLQITALPAFTDNYLWLLQNPLQKTCAVVDPGDAAPVLAWLQDRPDWQLTDILVTHHHFDHVGGVEALKSATGARVYGPALETIPALDVPLNDNQIIEVLGERFSVLHVPGHTLGHIAYYSAPLLFCGDTLFAAGCGRLFEGTAEQMHGALTRLKALPDDTKVYCTHEYTLSNLKFAAFIEPENAKTLARLQEVTELRAQNQMTLPSTLALEKATNPFLRTDQQSVTKNLEGCANADGVQVFAHLRKLKDAF